MYKEYFEIVNACTIKKNRIINGYLSMHVQKIKNNNNKQNVKCMYKILKLITKIKINK